MNENQRKRHLVRQGLTGLAQINGRNNLNWEKKIEYDLIYINKMSFLIDLKIFIRTIIKVFKKEDISADGFDTAEDLGDYLLRTNKISKVEYDSIMEGWYKKYE